MINTKNSTKKPKGNDNLQLNSKIKGKNQLDISKTIDNKGKKEEKISSKNVVSSNRNSVKYEKKNSKIIENNNQINNKSTHKDSNIESGIDLKKKNIIYQKKIEEKINEKDNHNHINDNESKKLKIKTKFKKEEGKSKEILSNNKKEKMNIGNNNLINNNKNTSFRRDSKNDTGIDFKKKNSITKNKIEEKFYVNDKENHNKIVGNENKKIKNDNLNYIEHLAINDEEIKELKKIKKEQEEKYK